MQELILISGANGFIGFETVYQALSRGYRVRGAVRRQQQIDDFVNNSILAPWKDNFEGVLVPNIEAEHAFNKAMKGCDHAIHLASPAPKEGADYVLEIINPAIRGTLSFLEDAQANKATLKTVVLMSSASALIDWQSLLQPERLREHGPYSEQDVYPTPSPPYGSKEEAYWASKSSAIHAAKDWIRKEKPEFQIIHIMPVFVVGRDLRARSKEDLLISTNGLILGPLLGAQNPMPLPGLVVDIEDVARISLDCLTNKVKGNEDFLLAPKSRDGIQWDNVFDFVRSKYPQSIETGIFSLTGNQLTTPYMQVNTSKVNTTFGELNNFDRMADSAVGQFIRLAVTEAEELAKSKSST